MQKYSPDIEPRRLHFVCPENIEKYWHNGSDIRTYHFNALALFLPVLEKLVVLSIKKSLKENLPETLKAQVSSLIAQEALHGSEFSQFNKKLFSAHYDIIATKYPLRIFRLLAGFINKISSSFHYSLSAAGEHFTAIAAELFLSDPKWFEGVSPQLSAIWRWHCIEEIEHKTVAYDVFQEKNGSYFLRILGMIMMTWVFTLVYIKPIWRMMKQDRKHMQLNFYLRSFQYYWGQGGLCRALFKPYSDYFKIGFHPSQHHNTELITKWKAFFKTASHQEIIESLQFVDAPIVEPLEI